MVRHQQHEPAMPLQMRVIMGSSRKNSLAHSSPAKLVLPPRHAVDGDENETPPRQPTAARRVANAAASGGPCDCCSPPTHVRKDEINRSVTSRRVEDNPPYLLLRRVEDN